tara:strand:- start:8650 stop:8814 length:165 start_codon:yes stop_codon:yes gene_type:complete
MELTQKERDLLKYLVKKELKEFKKEEAEIRPSLPFLKREEEYDLLLESLQKKFR